MTGLWHHRAWWHHVTCQYYAEKIRLQPGRRWVPWWFPTYEVTIFVSCDASCDGHDLSCIFDTSWLPIELGKIIVAVNLLCRILSSWLKHRHRHSWKLGMITWNLRDLTNTGEACSLRIARNGLAMWMGSNERQRGDELSAMQRQRKEIETGDEEMRETASPPPTRFVFDQWTRPRCEIWASRNARPSCRDPRRNQQAVERCHKDGLMTPRIAVLVLKIAWFIH